MLVQLVLFLILWVLIQKWKRRRFEKLYEQLKISAPRLPFLGHLYLLLTNAEESMKTLQQIGMEAIGAGGISGFWVAHKLYINVADPRVAEIILKTCLQKDDIMKCFHLATGDGSVFTSVKKWRPRRKFLAPTFKMANLIRFVENFSKQSCVLVEKLRSAQRGSMYKAYSSYSMGAVLGSLGIQINAQVNAGHPFLIAVEEVFNALAARVFQPWLYSDFVFKLLPTYHKLIKKHKPIVFGFIDEIIKEKRQLHKNYHINMKKGIVQKRITTFIDLMIESGDMNDVAIREESIVIIGAASETTAVALGYATLMLARYPKEQEKVYDELKKAIGDIIQTVTPKDLPRLKYLEAFIRETLRLYPPVPVIVRKIDKNIFLSSGVTLLPGCGAIINIWAINRNPSYWGEDAEEFRPERFLDSTPRHPAAFAAFSHGPRNCVGFQYAMMSMKTVLATMLQHYRFMPASDDLKHEPLRLKFDIMMRHVDNYCVKIEPRI